jgi:signal transduction histidine kinase
MMQAPDRAALDEALAALAHEFRTPLTAIRGFADLLSSLDGSEDEATRRDITARLLRNTVQLETLVDNMLAAAAQGGAESLQPAVVCLRSLANDVVDDIAVALAGHTFDVRGPAAYAYADPDAVTRIVTSLLTNAAHYSPVGSTIVIETETWSSRVVLSVSDAGPGVPKDQRAMVFERFWRGDVARERVRGLGLGLAVARELCVASGGDIAVCDAESGGARFEVSLPAAVL